MEIISADMCMCHASAKDTAMHDRETESTELRLLHQLAKHEAIPHKSRISLQSNITYVHMAMYKVRQNGSLILFVGIVLHNGLEF